MVGGGPLEPPYVYMYIWWEEVPLIRPWPCARSHLPLFVRGPTICICICICICGPTCPCSLYAVPPHAYAYAVPPAPLCTRSHHIHMHMYMHMRSHLPLFVRGSDGTQLKLLLVTAGSQKESTTRSGVEAGALEWSYARRRQGPGGRGQAQGLC